jgi:hypothetical protein
LVAAELLSVRERGVKIELSARNQRLQIANTFDCPIFVQ